MPKDDIRDLTHEQLNARFAALLCKLNEDQKELLWLVMQALRDPPGSADGPDAELIRQCDALHAVQMAINAAYEIIPEENELQRRAVMDPLNARALEIHACIFDLEAPTTPESVQAAALALLDQYPDGLNEARQDCNLAAWLSIGIAEYLANRKPMEIGFGTT